MIHHTRYYTWHILYRYTDLNSKFDNGGKLSLRSNSC